MLEPWNSQEEMKYLKQPDLLIDKFDKFFGCTNVSSLSAGKLSILRNLFKSLFSDFRLKVRSSIMFFVCIPLPLFFNY